MSEESREHLVPVAQVPQGQPPLSLEEAFRRSLAAQELQAPQMARLLEAQARSIELTNEQREARMKAQELCQSIAIEIAQSAPVRWGVGVGLSYILLSIGGGIASLSGLDPLIFLPLLQGIP